MPRQADEPEEYVEVVDATGRTIDTAEKVSAHQAPGLSHRAFSVFLLDADRRVLIQRRAAAKYHSPSLWSNTCCGHPRPGEAPTDAALRRLHEELGVVPAHLTQAGTVSYRVTDPLTGLIEDEWNHLYVGRTDTAPQPDAREVSQWRLVELSTLDELLPDGHSHAVAGSNGVTFAGLGPFTAWFPTVYAAVREELSTLI